jgi:hypothetical protein
MKVEKWKSGKVEKLKSGRVEEWKVEVRRPKTETPNPKPETQ